MATRCVYGEALNAFAPDVILRPIFALVVNVDKAPDADKPVFQRLNCARLCAGKAKLTAAVVVPKRTQRRSILPSSFPPAGRSPGRSRGYGAKPVRPGSPLSEGRELTVPPLPPASRSYSRRRRHFGVAGGPIDRKECGHRVFTLRPCASGVKQCLRPSMSREPWIRRAFGFHAMSANCVSRGRQTPSTTLAVETTRTIHSVLRSAPYESVLSAGFKWPASASASAWLLRVWT